MKPHIEALIKFILKLSIDEGDAYRRVKIANSPFVRGGIEYVSGPEVRFTEEGRIRTAKFQCKDPFDRTQILDLDVRVVMEVIPVKKDPSDRYLCGR